MVAAFGYRLGNLPEYLGYACMYVPTFSLRKLGAALQKCRLGTSPRLHTQ